MPHLALEYSANLVGINLQSLFGMQDRFANNAHDCDLTVEVRPMNAACYFKARRSP